MGPIISMLARTLVLAAILPVLVLAGEVNIFNSSTCGTSSASTPSSFTLSATQSVSCYSFKNIGVFSGFQSARTSLLPYCTFKAYTDNACKSLSHTISTQGASGSCLPVNGGIGSVSISCSPSTVLPRSEELEHSKSLAKRGPADTLASGKYFVQGQVTWNGKPSGGLGFVITKNVQYGNVIFSGAPTISSVSDEAKKVTDALFNAAAGTSVSSLTVSASNSSLSINAYSPYPLVTDALAYIGPAVAESLFANVLQGLVNSNTSTARFNVTNLVGIPVAQIAIV